MIGCLEFEDVVWLAVVDDTEGLKPSEVVEFARLWAHIESCSACMMRLADAARFLEMIDASAFPVEVSAETYERLDALFAERIGGGAV